MSRHMGMQGDKSYVVRQHHITNTGPQRNELSA